MLDFAFSVILRRFFAGVGVGEIAVGWDSGVGPCVRVSRFTRWGEWRLVSAAGLGWAARGSPHETGAQCVAGGCCVSGMSMTLWCAIGVAMVGLWIRRCSGYRLRIFWLGCRGGSSVRIAGSGITRVGIGRPRRVGMWRMRAGWSWRGSCWPIGTPRQRKPDEKPRRCTSSQYSRTKVILGTYTRPVSVDHGDGSGMV